MVPNECLGRLRRTARRDNVVPIVAAPADMELDTIAMSPRETPDDAAARAEVRALIERKLDELPAAFGTVFVLRCVGELAVEETAAALGLAETVRSRHFRARGRLRGALAREMDLAERDLYEFGGRRGDRIVAAVLERLRGLPPE